MLVFDLGTQKWKELFQGKLSWPNWTKDSKSIVFLDGNLNPVVTKVNLSDGAVERIVDLKDLPVTGYFQKSLSLVPDNSPLVLRDHGTQDVYSLDLEQP